MNSKSIHSLSEFLLHAGTDYRIFDLGRGVYPVSSQTFLDIENGQLCPPRPRQQHAWYAVVFWQSNPQAQRYIWFVKFPLDEQGLLIQASRNHFLQIIVDALGNQIAGEQGSDELPDNPYTFVPSQQLMAQFSAIARHTLNDPKSEGLEQAGQYLQTPAIIDWQQLPVQAIADLAVGINEQQAKHIINHFDQFSAPFLETLFSSLESVSLPDSLNSFFIKKLQALAADDAQKNTMLGILRALSTPEFNAELSQAINHLLNNVTQPDMHLLSVIAGRHDAQLDTLTAQRFLEAAAKADADGAYKHELFIGLFTDLVQIPALRRTMLTLARAHQHNPVMQAPLAALFKQAG
ncbi:DUF3549 family protein [Alteromonas lipolytica]|uniref:DUF3549 domain-containing protein n=1 Tax=Alteromonas lipolytica TaxID=1856405 RepID=A0A1E8FE76_9ALTE|nr:DUF3549 family protein [Alteromonas lipolytica]OFI34221.1 hypothetical protein BFC17_22050 [Alteromonas lipolytica]GGF84014.1 hypothetical protein GCM10011338_40390 [Alteromonas lipolytica]